MVWRAIADLFPKIHGAVDEEKQKQLYFRSYYCCIIIAISIITIFVSPHDPTCAKR